MSGEKWISRKMGGGFYRVKERGGDWIIFNDIEEGRNYWHLYIDDNLVALISTLDVEFEDEVLRILEWMSESE